jgi:signal transduction histidine kinase
MGVTQLAPAGDLDRAEDVWDSARWARLWDGLFYLTLAIPTVLAVAGGEGSVRSRTVTAALAAGFGAWYWAMLVLRRDWWGRRRQALIYLGVAAVFFWLLVARDSRFFILVYSLYPQVFGMLPDRWVYLGVAVLTVLPFAAAGRLDQLEGGDLLSMAANLALALLVGLFIQAIAGQSERRREMIAELERARAENAALLVKAREAAALEERQRLAREIHDTLAQGLTGVVTQLEAAEAALGDRPEAARGHLDTARRLARESLGEARRSVNALRPGPLEDGRLVDAITAVAGDWSRASGVPATVTSVGEARPLPSETEVALLRVAQEALANADRHAAASAVALTLAFGDGQVSLDVTDDGLGFDPAVPRSGNGSGGYGLTAMRERVAALRGSLDVESGPGQGTTVVATIPAGEAD